MARSLSSPRRSGAVKPLIRSIVRLFVAKPPPTRLPDLADDILQDIFLRIGTFADLACASSACTALRRIIADRSFLQRYRSLHPPLLLGVLYAGPADFQRAEAPHPNAAAAHVLACAAGFSFDYLPPSTWNWWDPCDVRDGRVLLKSSPEGYGGVVLAELAVCDPVFQRYFMLPPLTDDLLASAQIEDEDLQCFEPVLVPSGGDDDEDETSFKVIGRTYCETKTVIFVFSRNSGSWTVGASVCWDALGLNLDTPASFSAETCHYACGCFFWRVGMGNKLLKLDINRTEFSTIDLPLPPELPTDRRVVLAEAGEGRLVMFSHLYAGTTVVYYTTSLGDHHEGDNVWQMEGTVPLPSHYNCSIKCAAEGYLFLVGTRKGRGMPRAACFSLEIRSLKIERVSEIRTGRCHFYPYFGFPVSMSPRRI